MVDKNGRREVLASEKSLTFCNHNVPEKAEQTVFKTWVDAKKDTVKLYAIVDQDMAQS